MRRMIWIRFLHCFEILTLFCHYVLSKVFGLPHYSLHTTHYTTLINDINGLLQCVLIFQKQIIMSKNTNYLVVLSETKESKDKILGSYYPWVFTHGYQISRSPENTGNTRNWVKWKIFWVLCNICVWSIEYQIFPAIILSYLAQNKLNKHAFLHSILLNIMGKKMRNHGNLPKSYDDI